MAFDLSLQHEYQPLRNLAYSLGPLLLMIYLEYEQQRGECYSNDIRTDTNIKLEKRSQTNHDLEAVANTISLQLRFEFRV